MPPWAGDPELDRAALVARHDVELTGIDPASPLSVGNGEFCVTVDPTGLQTLPGSYPVADPATGPPGTLLGTMAQWGWHSLPGGDGYAVEAWHRDYATPTGPVRYLDLPSAAPGPGRPPAAHRGPAGDGGPAERAGGGGPAERAAGGVPAGGAGDGAAWLRANPHRLDLGRIGFAGTGPSPRRTTVLAPEQVTTARQRLRLWTGLLESSFDFDGRRVEVRTCCHPRSDVLAVQVRSPALVPAPGRPTLAIRLAFPYGSAAWGNAADWRRPRAHSTTIEPRPGGWSVERVLDSTRYRVLIRASAGVRLRRTEEHELVLTGEREWLELSLEFRPGGRSPGDVLPPPATQVERTAGAHWPGFWSRGGAVDLSGSTDPRAAELERRVVLSQYLTAVQCAGSLPPQETGLTCSSWRGRFHLEMHWWHAAHFALWGRPELLERSLDWYTAALPAARRVAAAQGYRGARWPRQVGPDARESPSPIGPFLLWQQPHPIHLAELVRRARGPAAVRRYAPVVLATAEFMASFAARGRGGYQLGPPLVPAQECYAPRRAELRNPTFELAYWRWGLRVAARWRRYLDLRAQVRWEAVADGLVPPPVHESGVLAAVERGDGTPWTLRVDHPSMLYALGPVPATGYVGVEQIRRTLADVLADWDWSATWGWDFPALAMTAARAGLPQAAVDLLFHPGPGNRYGTAGHNRQSDVLPVYLPGNGGLLAAVALMAAGWSGDGGRPAPGFPATGWEVRHEGLIRSP